MFIVLHRVKLKLKYFLSYFLSNLNFIQIETREFVILENLNKLLQFSNLKLCLKDNSMLDPSKLKY